MLLYVEQIREEGDDDFLNEECDDKIIIAKHNVETVHLDDSDNNPNSDNEKTHMKPSLSDGIINLGEDFELCASPENNASNTDYRDDTAGGKASSSSDEAPSVQSILPNTILGLNKKSRTSRNNHRAGRKSNNKKRLSFPFKKMNLEEAAKDLSPAITSNEDTLHTRPQCDNSRLGDDSENDTGAAGFIKTINFYERDLEILEDKKSYWNDTIIDFWMRW